MMSSPFMAVRGQGLTYAQNRTTPYSASHTSGAYFFDFSRFSASSLRPQASSTQAEKLAFGLSAFSRSTLASISSISSCGKRIPFLMDLLLLLPVAMPNSVKEGDNTIRKAVRIKNLDVCTHHNLMCAHTLVSFKVDITKPGSAATHTGPLTATLKGVTSWLVYSLPKLAPNFSIASWRCGVTRQILLPARLPLKPTAKPKPVAIWSRIFILVFAGRLPVQEVRHV